MDRTLLLGAGGLLGQAFAAVYGPDETTPVNREQLDIRNPSAIRALIAESDCDRVVNCAAHTDVEAAEDDPAAAYAANALLPGLLAAACRERGRLLVHISSTGCYGAARQDPYTEADLPQPTTVHHRSKFAGEEAVRGAHGRHLIIRTGWLFGGAPGGRKNFVWNRLLEAAGSTSITSDPHQVGCPTFALDAARQIRRMVEADLEGTFNVVAGGAASRLDYVSRIVAAAGFTCDVSPSARPFARRAQVSNNEAAINWYLSMLGMDQMPSWQDGVDRYVAELKSTAAWSCFES